MANFLLVGSGGREHAIAQCLCGGSKAKLFVAASSNNPGIHALCKKTGGEMKVLDIHDPKQVAAFAQAHNISLAFSSPDATLEAGVSDKLISLGIATASPTKSASRLEWDKAFARNLLKKYEIPGQIKFGHFKSEKPAHGLIDELGGNVAIKPVGLTGGKGVKISGIHLANTDECKKYASEIIKSAIGGKGGVVIEEKIDGEEFTLQAFSDGRKLYGMPLVQDHKLAYENDRGPNTGGMGSYSDANHLLPFVPAYDYFEGLRIMTKTVNSFYKETGGYFRGVLYGQFMKTKNGIKVIEFNSRFGDPEAMNVMSIFKGDLYSSLYSLSQGDLKIDGFFEKKATVCKYLVPEGYPVKSVTGQKLSIDLPSISSHGAKVYFASIEEKDDGELYTMSSRTMGIVGISDTIENAQAISEAACVHVKGPIWHRKDIGTAALIQKRIDHASSFSMKKEQDANTHDII